MDFDHDKIFIDDDSVVPICFVVITGNDLLDPSSTDAIIANGSETTVKFTGNVTDLPNSALVRAAITNDSLAYMSLPTPILVLYAEAPGRRISTGASLSWCNHS